MSHAFSHGYHPQHSERLAAYWAEALGGPSDYTQSLGDESTVVRMHSGNGEHQEMDERAQVCFAVALDDAGLPDDPRVRSSLRAYFRWAAEAMSSHPEAADDVPDGLVLPQWSWDGRCEPFARARCSASPSPRAGGPFWIRLPGTDISARDCP